MLNSVTCLIGKTLTLQRLGDLPCEFLMSVEKNVRETR